MIYICKCSVDGFKIIRDPEDCRVTLAKDEKYIFIVSRHGEYRKYEIMSVFHYVDEKFIEVVSHLFNVYYSEKVKATQYFLDNPTERVYEYCDPSFGADEEADDLEIWESSIYPPLCKDIILDPNFNFSDDIKRDCNLLSSFYNKRNLNQKKQRFLNDLDSLLKKTDSIEILTPENKGKIRVYGNSLISSNSSLPDEQQLDVNILSKKEELEKLQHKINEETSKFNGWLEKAKSISNIFMDE